MSDKPYTITSDIVINLNPDVIPAGSDLSIVNAARRSFNVRSDWETRPETYQAGGEYRTVGEYKLKDKDRRLLEFLARGMTAEDFENFIEEAVNISWDVVHDTFGSRKILEDHLWQWRNTPTHDTPFNHTFISFEVKAPIFVRAQLVKHEYLILSEFSRRYITDNIELYLPKVWREKAENKKQGSGGEAKSQHFPNIYVSEISDKTVGDFHKMISQGIAPEQARMILPQNTMTEWTWSGTLGAFAKMCTLRLHPEAQYEAKLVAEQVYEYLKKYYPVGARALVEGV